MTGEVRAVFSTRSDGDLRGDLESRRRFSDRAGIEPEWATVHQVHRDGVVVATEAGHHGDADALITGRRGLPIAVFTADCLGVVIDGGSAVGVAHAGWRGLVAGVIEATVEALEAMGAEPRAATIGPAIGPCCYEVGTDVADRFPDHLGSTSWGTTSVDLVEAARARLPVPADRSGGCTRCDDDSFSYRRDHTAGRMATVGWLEP
jgi:YfiH family protein